MFETSKFAFRISTLRKSKNLSQQQLAEAIGITKSAVSRIESASRAASIENVYAIAEYFNVTIDYLLGRSDILNLTDYKNSSFNSLQPDEKELISSYSALNDFSKGILLENAKILMEKQSRKIE